MKRTLQKKPYSCCRNFINLSYKYEICFLYVIYILFTSVCLIYKFYTLQKFLFVTVNSFHFSLTQIEKTRPENVFTEILLCSKYGFDQEKASYGLKNFRPNEYFAYSQLRAGFDAQIISHMNIHSRSHLKFIIFNTGTQGVLDL